MEKKHSWEEDHPWSGLSDEELKPRVMSALYRKNGHPYFRGVAFRSYYGWGALYEDYDYWDLYFFPGGSDFASVEPNSVFLKDPSLRDPLKLLQKLPEEVLLSCIFSDHFSLLDLSWIALFSKIIQKN